MKKIIDLIIILIWTYMVVVVPTFFFINIANFIVPNINIFHNLMSQTPSFVTLLAMILFFPGIGLILSYINKKSKFVFPWNYGRYLFLTEITIAASISYGLWRFLKILNEFGYPGLIFLFVLLFFYLPQAVIFFDSVDLSEFSIFYNINPKKIYSSLLKLSLLGIIIALFYFGVHMFVSYNNKIINIYRENLTYQSMLPKINKGEPYLIYRSSKIILYGRNFGLEGGKISDNIYVDSVHNQYEKIHFTTWDNNKIVFQVPLHWKYGKIKVWIDKEVTWKGKRIKAKSNVIEFKLLDATKPWNKNDDAYFEQLKHLDKETLKINGYNSK